MTDEEWAQLRTYLEHSGFTMDEVMTACQRFLATLSEEERQLEFQEFC